jgi:hypothetical protein
MTRRSTCAPLVLILLVAMAGAGACGSVKRMHGGDGAGDDDGGDASSDDDGGGDSGDGDGDAGATDGGVPDPAAVCTGASGDRIRQVVRRHDDGTSEVVALRDTEFGGNCQFQADRDGTARCLPRNDSAPFGFGIVEYTDAGCTNAIVHFNVYSALTPGRAMVPGPAGSCGAPFAYYDLGGALTFPEKTTLYYRDSSTGLCSTTTADTSASSRYFARGPEIGPERFVAATGAWSGEGRLAVQVWEGADGSRVCEPSGRMRDDAFGGRTCLPGIAEDDLQRCLPESYSVLDVSADAGCADRSPAAQVSAACDRDLDHAVESVFQGCRSRQRVRVLGDQLTGPLYADSPDGCVATAPGNLYVALGPTVAPASFADLEVERVPIGARLERMDMIGDGVRVAQPTWYDGELDVACRFDVSTDGALRCLPGTTDAPEARVVDVWSDPECTGPSSQLAEFEDRCETGAEPKYVRNTTTTAVTVHAIGQPVTGTRYVYSGGFCTTESAPARLYTIGPEVAPGSFVAGVEEIE